ncbi:Rho GTPase-activating protein 35 [Oopsacas minuta]|uniref:Rho GTPase-activating protein 35 n=1 Tax=Oopsacas minuta TaxID=111878 RepID=A0AAV7JZK0_9METZ|nr:Rho GTPase-activating protein 35 [Oopsacas minuta]
MVIPPQRNIPDFLEQCVNAIEGMSPNGMESEGIYRIPANQEEMINLINKFEADSSVHLTHHTQNIYTLAGTLKCFFQKLPDPLISEESAANLLKITGK